MKFWDASAIVPLLVNQRLTARLWSLLDDDPGMIVWWGSEIECVSALSRLARQNPSASDELPAAFSQLKQFASEWDEIDPSEAVREVAMRLLRVHPLRAADALQLAAAHLAAERRPTSLEFVTLDERLASAARKEGFVVIDVDSIA